MVGISSAGGQLKLPIGESPRPLSPELNRELQSVYNALHICNAYLTQLRNELEGSDDQDPSQTLRFRRSFWSTAGSAISAGDICCSIGNLIFPGIGTSIATTVSTNPALQLWHRYYPFYTGLRTDFVLKATHFFVALTDAAVGEQVQVGVGPGVIKVDGLKCGSLVWAQGAQGVVARASTVNGGPFGLFLTDRPITNSGSVFANNNFSSMTSGMDIIFYEGTRLPGYPFESGSWVYRGTNYFYPIGIAIRDDYVLIFDYKEG